MFKFFFINGKKEKYLEKTQNIENGHGIYFVFICSDTWKIKSFQGRKKLIVFFFFFDIILIGKIKLYLTL